MKDEQLNVTMQRQEEMRQKQIQDYNERMEKNQIKQQEFEKKK